jgi:hypothetical protein
MERGLSGASGGRQGGNYLISGGGLQAEDTFDSQTLKE